MGIRPKLLRAPFTLLFRFLARLAELIGGIHLPYTVRLGRRVRSGTTAESCSMPVRLGMMYTFARTPHLESPPGTKSALSRPSAIGWILGVGHVFWARDHRP